MAKISNKALERRMRMAYSSWYNNLIAEDSDYGNAQHSQHVYAHTFMGYTPLYYLSISEHLETAHVTRTDKKD